MARSFLMRAVFLVLFLSSAVSAATLDDYYLSRFGAQGKTARALAEVVPQEVVPAERCLTPLYRGLKRDWAKLEPATQKVLAKHVLRPTLASQVTFPSPGGHFNIHYAASGTDAPDLTDADANGVPDWVEKVASVFDYVYSVEVTDMGYRPPPVARYDIYLRNLVADGAYGFTTFDGAPSSTTTSVASYIEIDRAFTDTIFTAKGYTPVQSLDITAAHEFHHAIQYGYNYYFDMWYAEITSTWMEDQVYDSVNQLYSYLPHYLPSTDTISLSAAIKNPSDNSEYGRWIFNRYLAETHSTGLIKDIWVRLGEMAAPADGSDIPMLPVIGAAVSGAGSTLSSDFLGFARRLYLQDWATHTADTGLISSVPIALKATYTNYPVDMSAINAQIAALPHYTFAYFKFQQAPSAPTDLTLTLANVPADMQVIAIKKGSNGSVVEYTFDRSAGTITVPSFNGAATAEVQLIICNVTGDPAPSAATSGGGKGGGGCFIATAAYGSYLHPKVALLRAFRDEHLLTNRPGRLFVALYYRLSPPLARVIAEHEWMRAGVRVLLTPLVLAVEHPIAALLVSFLSGLGGVWRLTRRRRSIFASHGRVAG